MTIDEFNAHQQEFLGQLFDLTGKKSKEYNTTDDRFDHFKQAVGFSLCKEREGVAWEFCVKHLQSVRDLIKHVEDGGDVNGHPTQKMIDEKFGDIIVYMTLMHGMLTDRINKYEERKRNGSE